MSRGFESHTLRDEAFGNCSLTDLVLDLRTREPAPLKDRNSGVGRFRRRRPSLLADTRFAAFRSNFLDREGFYAAARDPRVAAVIANANQRARSNLLLTVGVRKP
jgi:hypothetical protein